MWVEMSTEQPSAFSSRKICFSSLMAWGSSPTRGSSKMTTRGLWHKAQQMDSFCCMPLESSLPSLFFLSSSSSRSSSWLV